MTSSRLVQLDQDHPGFRDQSYRERRDCIAKLALEHDPSNEVPQAPYTENEHQVWKNVYRQLDGLHKKHAFSRYLDAKSKLQLPKDTIQQLSTLNKKLQVDSQYRFQPVAGLIEPKIFLHSLANKVFLSTQYIRHESKPFYTPEPDVIHELIGHAPTFLIPEMEFLNIEFGKAALRTKSDDTILKIINAYWHTIEFGLVFENDELKAFGAGLLSSVDEIKRAIDLPPQPFELEKMSQTSFDPTVQQPLYFAAPSFLALVESTTTWLKTIG